MHCVLSKRRSTRALLLGMSLVLFAIPLLSTRAHADMAGATSAQEGQAAWTRARQESGIEVYTRPVAGSTVKAFKGEGLVAAPVERIRALLRDADRLKEWFPNTPASKLISVEGNARLQHTVMATPWPVTDRDNVFRSVTNRDPETGTVDIRLTAAPDAYPVQEDLHRVRTANGSWRLEPRGPNETWVEFAMHLEPGGGIPDWIVNARVVATPFEALRNLRSILDN